MTLIYSGRTSVNGLRSRVVRSPVSSNRSTTETTTIPYNFPYSIQFNGTSTKGNFTLGTGMPCLQGDSFSFMVWIKPQYPSGTGVIFSETKAGSDWTFLELEVTTSGNLHFDLVLDGGTVLINSDLPNSVLLWNQWQHICMTNNAGTVNLYVNGQEKTSGTWNYIPSGTLSINYAALGYRHRVADTNFYKGFMTDFRLYKNKIISQSELNSIINTGIYPSDSMTIFHTFSSTASNASTDQSGNGNNLAWANLADGASGERPIVMVATDNIGGVSNMWKNMGIHIGNNYYTNYDPVEAKNDLIEMRQYTQYVKMVTIWDNTTAVRNIRALALLAKSLGFNVSYGEASPTTTLTSSNWSSYSTKLQAAAVWAQSNGIDQLQIGNEEELHVDNTTLTYAQLVINLKALGVACQALFSGPILYAPDGSDPGISRWITAGITPGTNIDLMGIFAYNTDTNIGVSRVLDQKGFRTKIQNAINGFGVNNIQISEWNLSNTWNDFASYNNDIQEGQTRQRINILRTMGVNRAYFFQWRSFADQFSLRHSDGTNSIWFNPLVTGNRRNFFY